MGMMHSIASSPAIGSRTLHFLLVLLVSLSACGEAAPASSWPNAALYDDILYVANNRNIYALNPQSGALSWRFPQEGSSDAGQFYTAPASGEGSVIAGSFDRKAFAIDKATGRTIWSFDPTNGKSGGAPSAITTADGFAYLSSGNTVYALNIENGLETWSFQAQGDLWSPPVTDAERLYQTSMDHSLYALDVQTGREIWRQELAGALPDTPTLDDGVLYLGAFANRAYAIDAGSGRVNWYLDTEGWVWGSPVVVSDVAYFGDLDGGVYAVGAANGRLLWKVTVNGPVRSSPAVVGDTVVVNTDSGFVYSLGAGNGVQRWPAVEVDSNTAERLLANPIVHKGMIYVTALGGESLVYAYSHDTGLLQWQFKPGK